MPGTVLGTRHESARDAEVVIITYPFYRRNNEDIEVKYLYTQWSQDRNPNMPFCALVRCSAVASGGRSLAVGPLMNLR